MSKSGNLSVRSELARIVGRWGKRSIVGGGLDPGRGQHGLAMAATSHRERLFIDTRRPVRRCMRCCGIGITRDSTGRGQTAALTFAMPMMQLTANGAPQPLSRDYLKHPASGSFAARWESASCLARAAVRSKPRNFAHPGHALFRAELLIERHQSLPGVPGGQRRSHIHEPHDGDVFKIQRDFVEPAHCPGG